MAFAENDQRHYIYWYRGMLWLENNFESKFDNAMKYNQYFPKQCKTYDEIFKSLKHEINLKDFFLRLLNFLQRIFLPLFICNNVT